MKYLVAVRFLEDVLSEPKNIIHSFDNEIDRREFIKTLDDIDVVIDWATSETEEV